MSVIGIDFGNESCFIAAAISGGIETLANDYSLRATPSCVAFAGKKRVLGVPAKNQQVTNMKNTISNFKRLLGRKFNDPNIQEDLRSAPYRFEQRTDGGIGIHVNYLDQDHVFTPEQITAMLFTKLKETSEVALKKPIKDCVITVPSFYTSAERQALIGAAEIAGLNILHLLNETTSVALLYGFYKPDLPAVDEKPMNVVFVDFGQSQIQVSVCAYNRGKLKMTSSAWDQVGGRSIDAILAEYFANDIQKKYKVNARTNPRAYLRLLTETEKIKKQMSANSTKLPLNIDCFIDEIDVSSSMSRSDMEELCADVFKRVEAVCRKCLHDSKLTSDEIYAVEVVGGSTRIPAVKSIVEQVFGKPVNTTLNQDEAVSRGAALQCAILSPAVRVHDFATTDIQNYAVSMQWENENNPRTNVEMEVFQANHAFPFSRMITLSRREPFSVQLLYTDPHLKSDSFIGRWHVKNIKPTGEPQEVKIKVRININGVILVTGANLVDKKAAKAIEEPTSVDNNSSGSTENGNNMDTQEDDLSDDGNTLPHPNTVQPQSPSSATGTGWTQKFKGWFSSGEDGKKGKKKKAADLIELPLDEQLPGSSAADLQRFREEECKMIGNDEKEKERVDARNALEEFVYDMRDKLSEDGPLSAYIESIQRQTICQQLNDLENWLYEEGEDCENDVYRAKLTDLHSRTNPIKQRSYEYENQPNAFNELGHTVQMARKYVNEFRSNKAKYDHITETEILNVSEAAERAEKWLEANSGHIAKSSKTADPPVRVTDIQHEVDSLKACLNSVLSRPKPQPPAPPATAANNTTSPDTNNSNADQQQQPNEDGFEPTLTEDKMDVE